MYFELTWKVSPPDPTLANTERCDDTSVPWSMGVRYQGHVAQPINCWLNPKRGRTLRDAFLIDIPLFSDRLLSVLRELGVNNLQTYDSLLHTPEGATHDNYKAVNILGAVMCADLEKSTYAKNPGAAFIEFTHLVLDRSKTRDHEFFRLGERPGRIFMSERVAKGVQSIKPVGINLLPTETNG